MPFEDSLNILETFFKEINTPPFYDTSCSFVKNSSVHIHYFILCAYSLANVILGRNCKWALDSTRCTFLNEFSQIWSRNDLFLGAGLQLGYVSRSDWYLGPGQFILQVQFRESCKFWKHVWIILRKLSSISVCQHPTNISLWTFLLTQFLSHPILRPFGHIINICASHCVCGHYKGRVFFVEVKVRQGTNFQTKGKRGCSKPTSSCFGLNFTTQDSQEQLQRGWHWSEKGNCSESGLIEGATSNIQPFE